MRPPSPPRRFLDAWGDPLGPGAGGRLGTALFLVLVAVVAFYDLGARSLHTLDLPRFGVLAREMLRSGEWLVPTRYGEVYANKPPLHIWLVAGPAALAGEVSAFLVRWPSALGLVLLVLSASAWGRLRTGALAAGRAAALLLLGTYAVTRFGREGRPDMLASGLTVAATYFLDRAALGGHRRDPWVSGLLLGLALLAKGPALLVVPLFVLLLPSMGRPTALRLRTARPWVTLGVAVGVAALWFVPAFLHAGGAYANELLVKQAADRLEGTATHVEPLNYYAVRFLDGGAPWTPLYLAVALLLPWRRVLAATRSLTASALLTLVVFSLVPTKHLRYVIAVFPLLAIAAGQGIATWLGRPARGPWRVGYRAGALGVGVAALAFAVLVATGRGPGDLPASALLVLVLPLAALLLLAVAALGPARGLDAAAARRRLVGSALVATALAGVLYWSVRDRYRVRTRELFDRAVARAVVPGVPVYTVAPVEPGHVFHGAPEARWARSPSDLPSAAREGRLVVLLEASRRREVERARGEVGRELLRERMGDNWPSVLLLGFGPR